MKDNFPACLKIILKEEGGNDDDPRDPGGRTSRGIIQREWNVYRQTHPNRPQDVWQASNEDVADIYCQQYWQPYCDKIPVGVDLVFFNTCVNSGRQQAVKELQRALGFNPADGMMGMLTFDALDKRHDLPALIHNLSDQRRAFYKQLKTFSTFGKGWLARTARVEESAISMAANAAPKVVVSEHPQPDVKPLNPDITISPKAPTSEANTTTVSPETSGSATAGLGSLIAVINSIKDQLGNFTTLVPDIQYILLALTIIGIGYTIYSTIKKKNVDQAMGNV